MLTFKIFYFDGIYQLYSFITGNDLFNFTFKNVVKKVSMSYKVRNGTTRYSFFSMPFRYRQVLYIEE